MTARHKLNAGVLNGTLLIALLAGYTTESAPIFLLVLAVLLIGAAHTGDLRWK